MNDDSSKSAGISPHTQRLIDHADCLLALNLLIANLEDERLHTIIAHRHAAVAGAAYLAMAAENELATRRAFGD